MSIWLWVWIGLGMAVCAYIKGRIDGLNERSGYIKRVEKQVAEAKILVDQTVAAVRDGERLRTAHAQLRMMPIVGPNGTAKHEE
jgi:hypothetical protein